MINNFMKRLRLGATVLVSMLIVGGIISIFDTLEQNKSIMDVITLILVVVVLLIILYAIIYYWYGKDHKCPACNKRFCLKKEGKEIIGREAVSVRVETNTKNRNGEVIGTQEQYVPGERITYQVNYVCKKCGEQCYRTFSEDVPKV